VGWHHLIMRIYAHIFDLASQLPLEPKVDATYDLRAPKRPLNLSLNTDLVAQARELTSNLSAEIEALLAAFVAERKGVIEEQRLSLQKAAAGWNNFVDQHGSFADEFSTL